MKNISSSILNFKFLILNSRRAGFTLIELMIAVFITALAVAAAYSTFIAQQRSFIVQDQVAETQTSSKIAFDMIVTDLKNAGFGVPDSPNINGATAVVTRNNAAGPNGSDTITLVGGFRQPATLANAIAPGATQITIDYSTCTIGCTNFNITNMRFISIDGIAYAEITAIAGPILFLDRGIETAFPLGRPVYLIENVTYAINAAGNLQKITQEPGGGTLTTDIASNIDDLQFEFVDAVSPAIDRVSVNLLAATAREDLTLDPATKPYSAAPGITLGGKYTVGDANSTANADQIRRRIWSMEVAIRNQ